MSFLVGALGVGVGLESSALAINGSVTLGAWALAGFCGVAGLGTIGAGIVVGMLLFLALLDFGVFMVFILSKLDF